MSIWFYDFKIPVDKWIFDLGKALSEKNGIEKSWITAQSIIVGLVVKEALVEIYKNVGYRVRNEESLLGLVGSFSLSQSLLYLSFFSLLIRFYLGAFRFSQISEEGGNKRFVSIKNFIGSCTLFTFFFFMASSLDDTRSFVRCVLGLHLVDGLWFFATYIQSNKHNLQDKKKVSAFFLKLTLATIVVLLLIMCFEFNPFFSILFLIGISIFDLIALWDFYFASTPKFIWEKQALS